MTSIKTASWFAQLPDGHVRVAISRGVPRGRTAGYRVFRKLAPGPWFNSTTPAEYDRLYRDEVLSKLDPLATAAQLTQLAYGQVAVLVCYERAGSGSWCHRAMAAAWLAQATGEPVPELGYDGLAQCDHPLLPRI